MPVNQRFQNMTREELLSMLSVVERLVDLLPTPLSNASDLTINGYACCSGDTCEGHSQNCPYEQLNLIFNP